MITEGKGTKGMEGENVRSVINESSTWIAAIFAEKKTKNPNLSKPLGTS